MEPMPNHVVVVLEAVEGGNWFIGAADAACSALCAEYPQRYPEGINVSARLTKTKTVFTMTGYVSSVKFQLKKLGAGEHPGVGHTVKIPHGELKITSATITPPPPKKSQNPAATASPADDGYDQMLDFMYKMMSLSMQGIDS